MELPLTRAIEAIDNKNIATQNFIKIVDNVTACEEIISQIESVTHKCLIDIGYRVLGDLWN